MLLVQTETYYSLRYFKHNGHEEEIFCIVEMDAVIGVVQCDTACFWMSKVLVHWIDDKIHFWRIKILIIWTKYMGNVRFWLIDWATRLIWYYRWWQQQWQQWHLAFDYITKNTQYVMRFHEQQNEIKAKKTFSLVNLVHHEWFSLICFNLISSLWCSTYHVWCIMYS